MPLRGKSQNMSTLQIFFNTMMGSADIEALKTIQQCVGENKSSIIFTYLFLATRRSFESIDSKI